MKYFAFCVLVSAISVSSRTAAAAVAGAGCKCSPQDSCWPTKAQFDQLNSAVSGQLIHDQQPAEVCYPGPNHDAKACAIVNANAANSVFLSNTAVGLCYPVDGSSCVPVPVNQTPTGNCSIGTAPRYTVNATTPQHLAEGIKFAKTHNLRLVIRNTGHDILGRSTGAGSLQLWMRFIRDGINFQESYKPSDGCSKTSWTGSAIEIGGGYVWRDVYKVAAAHKRIVVGGGDPTVGCIGGWMQGGGHSPAAHNFGLGADQVLEAQVVLADGRLVTANACQNPDLFFAIRGGGPGTYGVVTSTTVKAYPEVSSVISQSLAFAPLTNSAHDMEMFMDAVADVYSAYPELSDHGYNGFGTWSVASPTPLFANFTVGFVHNIAIFESTLAHAKKVANPYVAKLSKLNGTSLFVSSTFQAFPSYRSYYAADSGMQQPVGTSAALGSRFLDRAGLTRSRTALKKALNTLAGTAEEFTSNNIIFVGGGAVGKPDRTSAVNPAWRKMVVHHIVARGWAPGSDIATIDAVHRDITFNKVGAMRNLVPNSGAYMNEADRRDQHFANDFYGESLQKLQAMKRKYDPHSLFYCKTCVDSKQWEEQDGRLCPTR